MALGDWLRRASKIGRRRKTPERETQVFPRFFQLGRPQQSKRVAFKQTPRYLRYFSRTPYARRAINAIKNPIAQLDWEIAPKDGVDLNSELKRQIAIVKTCLEQPNNDDSFRSLVEQVIEDVLCGAGAIEQQIGSDPNRPLWLWPVDGLSIQIYPGWTDNTNEARYLQTLGYGNFGTPESGIMLCNDELIYIRPNPTTSSPFGVGPLEVAFQTISRQLGVADYAGNLASNARPNMLLDLGEKVSPEELEFFRAWWRNDIEGQGVMPIAGGMQNPEVHKLAPEGDSALFLKYQDLLIREIATAFDLSPQNLGAEKDVNRNTSEVAEDRDWDQAIKPWAHLFASYLTRNAIQRRLAFSQLEFRFIGLDREDEKATAEIYGIYYKHNLCTPNEHRAKLGWLPTKSPWGEMFFADVEIAVSAARGAKQVDDPALTGAKKQPNDEE